MKYVVTLNGKDYEVEVDELSEAIVTSVAPTAACLLYTSDAADD